MRSQSLSLYPPGTTVFAKLRGYPWWPARVEDDQSVPSKVLKQKSKTKGPLWTVYFYGSKDYGFFGPDSIRPFDRSNVERDLKAKKFKNRDLEKAVRQALNPNHADNAGVKGGEASDDDVEEEVSETKPRTRASNRSVSRNKKPTNGKRKEMEDEESGKEKLEPERRRAKTRSLKVTAVGDDDKDASSATTKDDRSKRRKSAPPNPIQPPPQTHKQVPDLKQTPEFTKIYHLRHRLQKLVYDKKPGEIAKEDFPKITEALDGIDEQDSIMTYELLKSTKIGKVVKSAFEYSYQGDVEYKTIQDRCRNLLRRWKTHFEAKTQNATHIPPSAEGQAKSGEKNPKVEDTKTKQ